jgi:WD40 repeat protein
VRSISWSADDNFLFTAGIDGAIYEWEVKSLKRTRENVIKGCMYSCVVNVKDCKTFFAVGSDRKLKELDDTMVVKVSHNNYPTDENLIKNMYKCLTNRTRLFWVNK